MFQLAYSRPGASSIVLLRRISHIGPDGPPFAILQPVLKLRLCRVHGRRRVPRNVETIFLFSWIMSFLVGNCNIVRLPANAGSPVMEAVDLLIERLAPRANKRSSSSTIRLTPLSTPR